MEHKEYTNEECCGMCEGGCGHGEGCERMGGMHCRGRHHMVRWILGIFILVIVFMAGVKVGEFKENVRFDGYGNRMMNQGYGEGYGMMRQRGYYNTPDVYYFRTGMMQAAPITAPKENPTR